MRLVAICRVVQPELIVFEQVAVVGQERNAAAIFSVPSPSNWKYRMVYRRVGNRPVLFNSQRISTVCPFVTLLGTGMVSTVKG